MQQLEPLKIDPMPKEVPPSSNMLTVDKVTEEEQHPKRRLSCTLMDSKLSSPLVEAIVEQP